MPEVAIATAPPLAALRRVELIHTGQWKISTGVWNASREDLMAAVAAREHCKSVRRPVIKLGHSQGETPLWAGNPTGAPAVGWVDNLALMNQGHTLVGDFVGMPGWFGDIAASSYPDRSVEGRYDFVCQQGHTHPFVLTAVALLGVTPPGVGTLKSLQDVGALYGVEASSNSGTLVVARYDPSQPRDGDGRWSDGTGSAVPGLSPADDKLGLASRIRLASGERLVGSTRVRADRYANYQNAAVMARIATEDGPRLRLGIVDAGGDRDDTRRWSAANRGGTVDLDAAGIRSLRDGLTDAITRGREHQKRWRAFYRDDDPDLNPGYDPDDALHAGEVSSPWGDLLLDVRGVEDEDGGWGVSLGVRPPDAPADWGPAEHLVLDLTPAKVRQLLKELDSLVEEVPVTVSAQAHADGLTDVGSGGEASTEIHAHMPGKHDQSSHGRRYGPDGKPVRRLTRGGRRPAVRTLNRLLGDLEGEDAATRPGISGGPLADLVRGIRDGVDAEQFTPDQALQLLSSLVFRPDVANNPALSTALARATGELRDGERRDTTPTPDPVPQSAPDPEPVVPEPVALEPPVPTPPVARPPRSAPGPTPPDGGNAGLVARLRSSGSRDAARSMLDGLSVSQLKNVAREANIAFAQNTRKQDLLNLIVQWTVGRRLDSDAISRPAPSRIDAAVDEGDSNLKRYWTQNPEGLAKWVGKPHPWTSLFRQLREHVGSERAKRIAAEWFHERFGYWPGDKRHRDRVKASAPDAVDWPLHDEEAMTLPNPTPTVIHAAAQVTVDDVRTAFYRQASERTWIREFSAEPRELIVADDGSGGVARVAFDVADDGTITFSPPRKVRVAYVEDDEDHAVAASRMVYASAAESRPSIVTAHTVVPEAPDQPFADADDGDEPPEPPAAEPDQPINEEDDMSLTEVRQRLGLADDAEETAVLAAIDELKTKADSAPDPTTIAAAAAENATLTEKVTLLQEQVAGLSKQIADDNAAKAAEVKASVIDEAVTKGRITPADKDKWAERYDRAPDAVTDVLASIADGTAVPVSVIGKAGDPMAAADDLPEEPAWLYGPNEPALAGKE